MTTTMTRDVNADTAVADAGRVQVTTRLTEGFEIIAPVDGGADLRPFLNDDGLLDIYTVGTAANVYRFRPLDKADAQWRQDELGIQASQLFVYPASTAGFPTRDTPNIMGINNDGMLTLSAFNDENAAYAQSVSHPPQDARKIKAFRAVQGYQDNVYVNVILEDDTVGNSWLKPDGQWASQKWAPILQRDGSPNLGKARQIAMCSNCVQDALFGIDETGEVVWAPRFRTEAWQPLAKKAVSISVVADSEGRLNIFAVDLDGALWQKRQKKFPKIPVEWRDWIQVGVGTVAAPLQDVHAAITSSDALEVFGIGTDEKLYHSRQTGETSRGDMTWSMLFPLGLSVPNSVFAVEQNSGGYPEAYTLTHDNRLYRFWSNPNTTQWNTSEVLIRPTGEISCLPSNSVELTVLDSKGLIMADTAVEIRASGLVSIYIDGLSYVISESRAATVKTASDGRLVIERSTNSLSAPSLLVHVSAFMTKNEAVTIEANAELIDKMAVTTSEDVFNAKDTSGNYLLQGEHRTEENATALAQAMRESIGILDGAFDGAQPYLGGNRLQRGLRYVPDSVDTPFRLEAAQLEGRRFEVDLTGSGVAFRTLSADEATALFAESRTMMAAQDGLLGGLLDWLGDAWEAVKNGVATIAKFIVDGTKAILHLVIDGLTYVFEAVIQFVQQAVSFIEAIWAKVKVFFEKLWEWLAFLFNWKDIVRTSEAIEWAFNETLDFVTLAAKNTRDRIARGFDSIEAAIEQAIDGFLNEINPSQDIGQYNDEHRKPNDNLDDASGHNPMLNKFTQNQSKGDDAEFGLALAEDSGAIDEVIEKLKQLADDFEFGGGNAAWSEAMEFFGQIGNQKDKILTLLLSGVIKLGEAILLWGIEAARGVVLVIFDLMIDLIELVKKLFNEEWKIPVVSELWKWITGKELSFRPIQLISIIVAIPGTVIYKAISGKAPFPDDTSVTDFKGFFTAGMLAQRAGFPEGDAYDVVPVDEEQSRVLAGVFGALYGAVFIVRIPTEIAQVVASQNPFDDPNPEGASTILKLANVGLRYLDSVFSIPWVVVPDTGAPSCAYDDTTGFNATIWITQVICGPTRGLVLVKAPALAGQATLTIWGAAHLGMVIAMAVGDEKRKGDRVALGVLTCMGPQLFTFAANAKFNRAADYIPAAAYSIFIVLSYLTIAGLAAEAPWTGLVSTGPEALLAGDTED